MLAEAVDLALVVITSIWSFVVFIAVVAVGIVGPFWLFFRFLLPRIITIITRETPQ